MQNLIKLSGAILTLGACNIALAAEHFVVREYHLDASEISEFKIDAGIGVLDVEPSEDDELRIELEIEGNRKGFLRFKKRDVSEIDIKTRIKGSALYVELSDDDYDDLELHWRVFLPAFERTELNLSVGQINASVGHTNLEVDLGVGEANITMPRAYAGKIDMEVGVGGLHLKGAENVDKRRAIVSEEARGNGEGTNDIEVDVGVGEANVVLSHAT